MNLRISIAVVATACWTSTLSALGENDLQNRVEELESEQSDNRSTIDRLEFELEDLKNRLDESNSTRHVGVPRKTLTPAEEEDAKLRVTGDAIRLSFDGLSGLIKLYNGGRERTAFEEQWKQRFDEIEVRKKDTREAYEKRDAANEAALSVDAATSRVGSNASVSGLADRVKFDCHDPGGETLHN